MLRCKAGSSCRLISVQSVVGVSLIVFFLNRKGSDGVVFSCFGVNSRSVVLPVVPVAGLLSSSCLWAVSLCVSMGGCVSLIVILSQSVIFRMYGSV